MDRVRAAVEHLTVFPRAGRIVPEDRRRELREIIVLSYRVMYWVEGDNIEIEAIIHGARRLTDLPDPQE